MGVNARVKMKSDTSTNWSTNNPILLSGEIGLEYDTNKIKVGDGTTNWNSLDYYVDTYNKDTIDEIFGTLITTDNYETVRREWFKANIITGMTDFTELCDRWYKLSRTGWTGGTTFDTDDSTGNGIATGDNVGLTCTPSTNTTANTDDYANLPQFAPIDCNFTVDSTGKKHITAIDGICGDYHKDSKDYFVGVLQMNMWIKYTESGTTYSYQLTDKYIDETSNTDGFNPMPEAIDPDNTIRTWVVHSKYPAASTNYGSYSGIFPRVYDISHNSSISKFHTFGNQYCGKTSVDDAFIKIMLYIKYKIIYNDGKMNGCNNYYYDYTIALGETGVERVLLSTANGATLLVGSTIQVRDGSRSSSAGAQVQDKKITAIETVTIDGTDYSAVSIDNGGTTFDTTTGTTHVMTMPWFCGSCDNVEGNDGSPTNNTDNKQPFIIQRIEMMHGAYEVLCDSILTYSNDGTNNVLTVSVCNDATKLTTSVTSDYVSNNYNVICPATAEWSYIKKFGYDPTTGCMFPEIIGGSSSTYAKDAIYILAASSGNYEWLSLGHLSGGSLVGVSCVAAASGLSGTSWGFASRLSPNGMRGEYVSA